MLLMPGGGMAGNRTETAFLSKYAALLDILLRTGDVVIVVVAALGASMVRFGTWAMPEGYWPLVVNGALLTALVYPACGLYRSWRGAKLRMEVARIMLAWSLVVLGVLAISWMLKTVDHPSRLWMGEWYLASLLAFILSRLVVRRLLGLARSRGLDVHKVVLIGATEAGARILQAARSHAYMGLEVIGYVSTPYDHVVYEGVPRVASLENCIAALTANPPDQLWLALPLRAEDSIREFISLTQGLSTQVRLVPDLFEYQLINHPTANIAGVPIITLRGRRVEGYARIAKAVEDRLLALLFLAVLWPFMLLIAVVVKCSSPGPVIFKQKRHGLDGKEIDVWKFRSMRQHSETEGRVTQAKRDDDRITLVGRFLRKTSLDELPQLINVLQGQMSLVGPRPHAVEHNREFSQKLKDYMQRHGVKPGITGLAQVNGFRGETDTFEKLSNRVELDIAYIQNWSIWLDLKIVLMTPVSLLLNRTNAY